MYLCIVYLLCIYCIKTENTEIACTEEGESWVLGGESWVLGQLIQVT